MGLLGNRVAVTGTIAGSWCPSCCLNYCLYAERFGDACAVRFGGAWIATASTFPDS